MTLRDSICKLGQLITDDYGKSWSIGIWFVVPFATAGYFSQEWLGTTRHDAILIATSVAFAVVLIRALNAIGVTHALNLVSGRSPNHWSKIIQISGLASVIVVVMVVVGVVGSLRFRAVNAGTALIIDTDTFLSVASFALALGGLIPVFVARQRSRFGYKLVTILLVLITLTGFTVYRGVQHARSLAALKVQIFETLSRSPSTLDQLTQDLPFEELPLVQEVLDAAVAKGDIVFDYVEVRGDADGSPFRIRVYRRRH